MKKTAGFTLIELLIVIAIIGILAAVLIPNLLNARKVAQDRASLAYAQNVYKAAQAYYAENTNATALPATACTTGYTAGSYSVPAPGGAITNCVITDAGPGSVKVDVTYTGGVNTTQKAGY